MLSHEEIKHLCFPRSVNLVEWKTYLNRKLTSEEKSIIYGYRSEVTMNLLLEKVINKCNESNLCVPVLTNLNGNCLFESLHYHKIGNDVKTLRAGIASLLYMFKNFKNFIPNIEYSMEDAFQFSNEIQYVGTEENKVKTFYKYSFDIMCQDLSNNHNWDRIPTELVLRLVSYLYKVKIIVINGSNDFQHVINSFEGKITPPTMRTIYLGHLGEVHYVPIDYIDKTNLSEPIFYVKNRNKFMEWAKIHEINKISEYIIEKIKNEFSADNSM